ncbi:MAG TPA: sigma 54-interacting transcriptional regulator [Thermoanaerobaculia bacterium]|nr:sigma 54-interacting transcriptional regulator [Thermoanaerobaculia bacterium]
MKKAPASTSVREVDTRIGSAAWQGGARVQVPGLTILWHPNPRRVGERVPLPDLISGRPVALSRLEPAFSPIQEGRPRALEDVYLSRSPIRIEPDPSGGVRLVPSASRTRVLVEGRPLVEPHTVGWEALGRGAVVVLADRVVLLLHLLPPFSAGEPPSFGLVGESPAMITLREAIRQVADLPIPVLLRGETGTGKELVAHALHRASPRHSRPFIAVNLGALPPTLAAAELFGAAEGSYTGAVRRRDGLFVRAEGGTLFLDEIGEASAEVQVLLLRALENGEIHPLGSDRPRRVEVRVLAATDADLEKAAAEGRFRSPLLHRLSGWEIRLPALAERRDDLGRLLLHFLGEELASFGEPGRLAEGEVTAWLPAPLVAQLAGLTWPGNVRQLRNVARRLAVLCRGGRAIGPEVTAESLAGAAEERPPEAATVEAVSEAPARKRFRAPSEVVEAELLEALAACEYRLKPTAERLGVSRTSLYSLIERHPTLSTAARLGQPEIEAALAAAGGDEAGAARAMGVSREALALRRKSLEPRDG